jgi:hypothetical protein
MHIVIACDASAVFQCEGSCMSYVALLHGHLIVYDGEPHPGYARAHPINVPQCSSSRRPGSAMCAARIKTIFLVYIRYTSRVCAVPVTQKSMFLVNIRDTSKVCACAGTTRYHQDIYRLVHMHLKTTYLHVDTHMRYVTRTDMHALHLHIAQPAGCYQATARPSHGKRLYRA